LYEAKDYHQNYFNQHRGVPYCQAVVASKVAKFKAIFVNNPKDESEIVNATPKVRLNWTAPSSLALWAST